MRRNSRDYKDKILECAEECAEENDDPTEPKESTNQSSQQLASDRND